MDEVGEDGGEEGVGGDDFVLDGEVADERRVGFDSVVEFGEGFSIDVVIINISTHEYAKIGCRVDKFYKSPRDRSL